MIEVRNLTKKYGDHLAVDNLSFSIDKGKIYGFLGPNGAGKSTTMNIITGYLAATDGTVVIDGADILKEPEKAKNSVGYLPEIPPVYTDMTVEEYLGFAAELKGIPKDERRLQTEIIMRRVKLEEVSGRLIGNLSKGYRQRVGLAQAMIGFPETIILDEPMVGLDPQQIIEIRSLIRSLAKNHTVIMSSHILAEVRELCDYIIMISGGKLVASDTPENLERHFGGDDGLVLEVRGEKKAIRDILENLNGCGRYKIASAGTAEAPDVFRVEISRLTGELNPADAKETAAAETEDADSAAGCNATADTVESNQAAGELQADNDDNAASDTPENKYAVAEFTASGGSAVVKSDAVQDSGAHKDLREELFFAFAKAGIPILSMTEKQSTLEEVYLKLTQEGGAAVEGNI